MGADFIIRGIALKVEHPQEAIQALRERLVIEGRSDLTTLPDAELVSRFFEDHYWLVNWDGVELTIEPLDDDGWHAGSDDGYYPECIDYLVPHVSGYVELYGGHIDEYRVIWRTGQRGKVVFPTLVWPEEAIFEERS